MKSLSPPLGRKILSQKVAIATSLVAISKGSVLAYVFTHPVVVLITNKWFSGQQTLPSSILLFTIYCSQVTKQDRSHPERLTYIQR